MDTQDTTTLQEPSYPVSFCVIASVKDMQEHLLRMLRTIPTGAEVCILLNEQGKEDALTDVIVNADSKHIIRSRKWTYERGTFSSAKARNLAHDMATTGWIFLIDCDELLCEAQHEGIADATVLHGGGVGGFMAGQASLSVFDKELGRSTKGEYINTAQCRMYRNKCGFTWEGHAHEQIEHQIQAEGYTLVDTTITIVHNGYTGDLDTLRGKLERNSDLIGRWLAENSKDHALYKHYRELYARDTNALIQLEK